MQEELVSWRSRKRKQDDHGAHTQRACKVPKQVKRPVSASGAAGRQHDAAAQHETSTNEVRQALEQQVEQLAAETSAEEPAEDPQQAVPQQMEKLQAAHAALEQKCTHLQEQVQQQAEQQAQEAAAKRAAQGATEQALQAARQEKDRLQCVNATLEQRCVSLKHQLAEAAAITQKALLESTTQQAEQLAQQLKQQAQEAAAAREELLQTQAASKAGQQAADKLLAGLRQQLVEETTAKKTAEEAAENARQAAQQEREQLHTVQQQLKDLQEQLAMQGTARQIAQQAAEVARQAHEAAQGQVEKLQPAHAALESERDSLLADKAQLERSLAEQARQHDEAVQALQQQLVSNCEAAVKETGEAHAQVAQQHGELQLLKHQLLTLSQRLELANLHIEQQHAELQQLQGQLALTQWLAAGGAVVGHQQRQGNATLTGMTVGLPQPPLHHPLSGWVSGSMQQSLALDQIQAVLPHQHPGTAAAAPALGGQGIQGPSQSQQPTHGRQAMAGPAVRAAQPGAASTAQQAAAEAAGHNHLEARPAAAPTKQPSKPKALSRELSRPAPKRSAATHSKQPERSHGTKDSLRLVTQPRTAVRPAIAQAQTLQRPSNRSSQRLGMPANTVGAQADWGARPRPPVAEPGSKAASGLASNRKQSACCAARNPGARQTASSAAPAAADPAAASRARCTDTRVAAASAGSAPAVPVGHAAAQERSSLHPQSDQRCKAAPQTAGAVKAVPSAKAQAAQQQRPADRTGAPPAGRRGAHTKKSLAAEQPARRAAAQWAGRQPRQTRKQAAPAPAEGHMAKTARPKLPVAAPKGKVLLSQTCSGMAPSRPSSAGGQAVEVVGAQGGFPAGRCPSPTASGASAGATTSGHPHLTGGADADERMAWGSSAGAAAPAGGQPPGAATGADLQHGSEAVRPLDAAAAAAAGEQPPAAAMEEDLQLGSDALHDAAFGGTSLAGHQPEAELFSAMADCDAIMATTPAEAPGMQEPGAQVAPSAPLDAPRRPVLHPCQQLPHLKAVVPEVSEDNPEVAMAHLLSLQAAQGDECPGGWDPFLLGPDAMEWQLTASELAPSTQGLQAALRPGCGDAEAIMGWDGGGPTALNAAAAPLGQDTGNPSGVSSAAYAVGAAVSNAAVAHGVPQQGSFAPTGTWTNSLERGIEVPDPDSTLFHTATFSEDDVLFF